MKIDVVDQVLVRSGREDAPAMWLIHGFGESGACFLPLFETVLGAELGLFVPDLPGFGASPPRGETTLDSLAAVVSELITRRTPDGPVGLVGHSLGGPIAVRVAEVLDRRVLGLFSIEGNLTEADAYFSGGAASWDEPAAFRADLAERVLQMAEGRVSLRRYFASLMLADAESLWRLGRDALCASRGDALGTAYRALACPKLYYWSDASTPAATQRYLETHGVPSLRHAGGHWPMIDGPGETAAAIARFIRAARTGSPA